MRHYLPRIPIGERRGTTIVEALVVVGLIALFASILVVYTRGSENQIVFFKEQTLFVNTLLRAKSFAIETFQPKYISGTLQFDERVCGWGVYVDKNPAGPNPNGQFIIFRDRAPGVGGDCNSANQQYDQGQGEAFETFGLDSSVRIGCIGLVQKPGDPCPQLGSQNQLDVTFIPPDPVVVFKPSAAGDKEAVIRLELLDGSRSIDIRVSSAGQISY